jgi:uncharacterized integral membrane protein
MERSSRDRRPSGAKPPPTGRREQARTIALVGLGVLGGVFALLNFDEVEVNWLLGTWSTPLIVVIAISFLLGAGVCYLAIRRRRA